MKRGIDQSVMAAFCALLAAGNSWLMVSVGYRSSAQEHVRDEVAPVMRAVIDMAPDRVIWATDWPHVQYRKQMPADTELL